MAGERESAATVLGKISRTHLECVICHERYQTPKLLDCLHSFCEKCLVTYNTSAMADSSAIVCPVCRKETKLSMNGVPGLRTNFHLMGMVEDFTIQEKLVQTHGVQLSCELCQDQQEADSRCMDCPFFLCGSCRYIHQRIAATANHDVLTLDTLRSGVVSVRSKAKNDPPCDEHPGEKKRFFCETCNELICRDCTVVKHRDPQHKYTTVNDAASSIRQITKDLLVKVEASLEAHNEAQEKLTLTESELTTLSQTANQRLIDRAEEEDSKVAERTANIEQDIARRKKQRSGIFQENGLRYYKSKSGKTAKGSDTKEEAKTSYSQAIQYQFTNIDKTLATLNEKIDMLLKTDQQVQAMVENLTAAAEKDTTEDKNKIADSKKRLTSLVVDTCNQRQQAIQETRKILTAQIVRLRHSVETATDLVNTASNVDFLSLHSVINEELIALLDESPSCLLPGFSNIEFKSKGDTGLGELIMGPTWKRVNHNKYTRFQGEVTSICSLNGGKFMIGQSRYKHGYGERSTAECYYVPAQLVAEYPNGDCAYFDGRDLRLFDPKSSQTTFVFRPPSSIRFGDSDISLENTISMTHYKNKRIAVGYNNWQGVLVHDFTDGSIAHKLQLNIKPDILTSTSKGRLLVCARSPPKIEGLDGTGATKFTIEPGIKDAKQVSCVGLCCDKRDIIYVAISVEGVGEVHIHYYSPCGTFMGCFVTETNLPFRGIAVTSDDRLLLASARELRQFQME